MPLPRLARAGAVGACLLLLAACSGDDGGGGDTGDDLGQRLETARAGLDDAESLQIRLATDALPDGTQGLVEADGVGNHEPAFEGTVTVVARGFGQVDAELVSVGGEVVAKIGFVPDFTPIDPGDYGAPDPAQLVAAEGGVSSWLTASEDLEEGEQSRDGEDVLTTVGGTLPGEVVRELIPSADAAADFTVAYRLTDEDVLRDATIEGPFYAGGDDVTYSLDVAPSDEPVEITLP